jgi:hypothetical protein
MRERRPGLRAARWVLAAVLGTCALVLVGAVGLPWCGVALATRRIEHKKEQLLRRTDHQALLVACRAAIATLGSEVAPHRGDGLRVSGSDPRLPSELKRLEASYIAVSQDAIHVELGGGFFHYGVDAIASDASPDRRAFLEAMPDHKRLADGLWYYEEQ